MKTKYFILLTWCIAGMSCSKEFLNQPPEDQLTSEVFYKNVSQINMGVLGCYPPLQGMYNGGNMAWTLGLVSDEISAWNYVVDATDLFNKDFSHSIGWLWSTGYNNIQRCNRMIQVIKAGEFEVKANEKDLLNSYLAEAEFIRALNYFNMVRMYGSVPLVTEPFTDPNTAIGIGRTPASEVYEKVIIPGFKFAAENALVRSKISSQQLGRVTSGAGYTMLAHVYMTLKRYADAEAALKKVIDSKEYDLMPTLAQVFSTSSENNRESIFEIQYDQNLGNGSLYNRWIGWNIAPFVGATASNQSINVSRSLVSLYKAENDMSRFNTWITETAVNSSGVVINDPFPKKYVTTGLGAVAQNNNFIVTRYADVLLLYAEALAMQSPARVSEALADVNRIRTRAGMSTFTTSTLTLDAIWKERQLELSFEGHRWFDLLRTGRAQSVMGSTLNINVPAFQLLFPIPISEIQKDPTLPQTPGY
jgi:tetratricopeptide (TPR) repeat protein